MKHEFILTIDDSGEILQYIIDGKTEVFLDQEKMKSAKQMSAPSFFSTGAKLFMQALKEFEEKAKGKAK